MTQTITQPPASTLQDLESRHDRVLRELDMLNLRIEEVLAFERRQIAAGEPEPQRAV